VRDVVRRRIQSQAQPLISLRTSGAVEVRTAARHEEGRVAQDGAGERDALG
jgi:hypothetical protein